MIVSKRLADYTEERSGEVRAARAGRSPKTFFLLTAGSTTSLRSFFAVRRYKFFFEMSGHASFGLAQKKVSRKRARKGAGVKSGRRKKTTSSTGRTAVYERVLGPKEKKNIDTTLAAGTSGTLTNNAISPIACINASVAGALAAGQRIGRNIMMRSILIRGKVSAPSTMTGTAFFRFVVFYDRESNGSQPVVLNVFAVDDIHSPANLGNARRFKVLADYKLPFGLEDSNSGVLFERYIKCNLPVRYIDGIGTGTYTDIVEGAVWVIVWLGGTTAGTTAPVFSMLSRVRYDDC